MALRSQALISPPLASLSAERGMTDVTITYRTFLLDPDVGPAGKNIPEMLKARYGRDPAPMFARVESEARNTGIALELAKQPMMYSTLRAHTLLRHAVARKTQRALNQALFAANFLDAKNISDADTLAEIASAHGFTKEEAHALVTSDHELAITRAESDVPKKLGISGAPFFVFNEKLAVSGAQPEPVFNQVLDELVATT